MPGASLRVGGLSSSETAPIGGLILDFPDRTEFPEHEALWDGANYKTAY